MTRRAIAAVVRLAAKIFFRRIEIAGIERVPQTSPVIFAVNHPNALIDPLFLLCFAPRRVSFLAKAPLFRTPLIRWFVRAFDSIPVYRKQDAEPGVPVPQGNRETFARSRSVLEKGGAIAIFPEGTTHSDPRLRELKTGAARIALGSSIRVSIIPTGLYYTAKQTFRSSALAYFGVPIVVEPEAVDQTGEPNAESVRRLTDQIDRALSDVTLQADSHAALELIARAERIFSAGEEGDLARELQLRRQFVAGYAYLREHDPARLTRLETQIRRIEVAPPINPRRLWQLILLPVGVVGALIHWPVYRLIGLLATHLSSDEDEMIATIKVVAGIVLYPLFWIAVSVVWGFALLILLPLLGYVALVTLETLEDVIARIRYRDTRAEEQAIREQILAIARELNVRSTSLSVSGGDSSPSESTGAEG